MYLIWKPDFLIAGLQFSRPPAQVLVFFEIEIVLRDLKRWKRKGQGAPFSTAVEKSRKKTNFTLFKF